MKKVAIAIGDAATGDFILPVLPLLDREGIQWQIFVDPARKAAGANTLRKNNILYVETETLPDPTCWDIVICGTAAKSQTLVRNATLCAVNVGTKVIWAGDFYGSGCEIEMLDLAPDWITALDETAANQVRVARPKFPSDHVRMIGNPGWDRISKLMVRRHILRDQVFSELKLSAGTKLIVVGCSDTSQFAEKEMMDTILTMREYCCHRDAVTVFLFHPADQRKDFWSGIINESSSLSLIQVCARLTGDSLSDLLMADAAVVQYSQLGCQSALAVPTLFTLLPSIRKYLMGRGSTWAGRFFPQILHHAAEVAWDVREIAPALDRMLGNEPGYHDALDEARKKHFSSLMDGYAAERFLGLVLERLNYRGGQHLKWLGGRP